MPHPLDPEDPDGLTFGSPNPLVPMANTSVLTLAALLVGLALYLLLWPVPF